MRRRRGFAGLLHFQVVNFQMTATLIIAEEGLARADDFFPLFAVLSSRLVSAHPFVRCCVPSRLSFRISYAAAI